MPELAPVTNAFCPFRYFGIACFCTGGASRIISSVIRVLQPVLLFVKFLSWSRRAAATVLQPGPSSRFDAKRQPHGQCLRGSIHRNADSLQSEDRFEDAHDDRTPGGLPCRSS